LAATTSGAPATTSSRIAIVHIVGESGGESGGESVEKLVEESVEKWVGELVGK
jgi:hypothetical protein